MMEAREEEARIGEEGDVIKELNACARNLIRANNRPHFTICRVQAI